jgi:predicted dehydrogenase
VNHPEIEVEDSAVAIVRFAGGTLATIIASNSQRPGLYARIHVHGTRGWSVGVETDGGSIFVAGVSLPSIARNDLWTIPGEEDQLDAWAEADRASLANVDIASHYHELQLRDVVSAIRDGRQPAVTGADGLRTVDLMAGIYQASREGRRVALAERGSRHS